jgi:hypothetical protein
MHPHICTVYDVGEQQGTAYLVMEYLEGETLADWLKKGARPLERALHYAIQIANAGRSARRPPTRTMRRSRGCSWPIFPPVVGMPLRPSREFTYDGLQQRVRVVNLVLPVLPLDRPTLLKHVASRRRRDEGVCAGCAPPRGARGASMGPCASAPEYLGRL